MVSVVPAAFDPRTTPWSLTPDEFPRDGGHREQLAFLLRYATL